MKFKVILLAINTPHPCSPLFPRPAMIDGYGEKLLAMGKLFLNLD